MKKIIVVSGGFDPIHSGHISYLNEAKKYARQCRQIKKTYGGAYFELGVAELNLCNKATGIKSLQKAAKYDRRYRSEVKRIIKKIDSFTDHCE